MESQPAPSLESNVVPSHDTDVSRRAFLRTMTGALAVGFAIQILGCSEEDPLSAAPTPKGNNNCAQPGSLGKPAATDRNGTIGSNHGHVALVTAAAQDAGTAFNLDIKGTAAHTHTVSLTAQDLADLKAGLQVTKTSSTTGHSHSVTFAAVTTSIVNPC